MYVCVCVCVCVCVRLSLRCKVRRLNGKTDVSINFVRDSLPSDI